LNHPNLDFAFGKKCRSFSNGTTCLFVHSTKKSIDKSTPCRFGEKCRSFSCDTPCLFVHSPETIKIIEMMTFMKDQGILHKHTTPVVCAIQYYRHAYTPVDRADKCVYTTIDGTTVFKDGRPIGEFECFSNAHYGPMGQSYGGLEGCGILAKVRKMYFDWYCQHTLQEAIADKLSNEIPINGLFKRPNPLEAHKTYCGN
jgi:hypothetical protein